MNDLQTLHVVDVCYTW